MRIITLNTWKNGGNYERRVELMIYAFKKMDPDIIFLQESFQSTFLGLDTAASIRDELKMELAHTPAREKVRLHHGKACISTSGLSTLSKYPIVSHQQIALPQDPRDGERIAQLCRIDVNKISVCSANIHFTHLREADELRLEQTRRAFEKMMEDQKCLITLMAGDFNATIDSPSCTFLQAPPINARDSFSLLYNNSSTTPRKPTIGNRTIDFIFFFPNEAGIYPTITQTKVEMDDIDPAYGLQASDHAAVLADISIN